MDIANLYSVRIQRSFDDDLAEILDIFKANQNKSLKLINYYKGLPLSYAATIASTDHGAVDFEVTPEQAYAIESGRYVFIRSPLFKYDLFARAQYVNVKKRAASFVKFCYVEIMAERRNFIRMVPEPSPTVVIGSPQGEIEGEVLDVSITGVSILIHHSCPLEPGCEVPISFTLKSIDTGLPIQINLAAKLICISGDALPRNYKFAISSDRLLERQLSQYMIQRQIEIIKEIKDTIY
jgi:hypothetical protein